MMYDPDLEVGSRLERALTMVAKERRRQLVLQEQGVFKYTLSDAQVGEFVGAACIAEETGEVARAVLCRAGLATDDIDLTDEALLKELSQVAALSVAWMEKLMSEQPPVEFSGITSAPDNPIHVEQVINHIAHLDEEQVTAIRNQLNLWHETALEREAGPLPPIEDPNIESGYDGPVAREGEVSPNHPAHPQWHEEARHDS
jgi:NTP pyrophosphatase (non-canonical NTP hydrolase)